MIMLGTQKVVSVTAGNFYKLNFALVTQVDEWIISKTRIE